MKKMNICGCLVEAENVDIVLDFGISVLFLGMYCSSEFCFSHVHQGNSENSVTL